jgi:hypothetical protein
MKSLNLFAVLCVHFAPMQPIKSFHLYKSK